MIGEVSWLTTRTMNGLMVAGGDELQISMGSGHIRGGLGDHQSSPPGRLRLPGATRWLDFCGAFCSRSACQLCAWPPLAMEQLRWNQHFRVFFTDHGAVSGQCNQLWSRRHWSKGRWSFQTGTFWAVAVRGSIGWNPLWFATCPEACSRGRKVDIWWWMWKHFALV